MQTRNHRRASGISLAAPPMVDDADDFGIVGLRPADHLHPKQRPGAVSLSAVLVRLDFKHRSRKKDSRP